MSFSSLDHADAIAVLVGRDPSTQSMAGDRRQALGLLLRHLALGERVAQAAAARQATIAPDQRCARFLRSQARHEALHARLFDTCAAGLGAPALVLSPCPYAEYETRLLAATRRGAFAETVVGTQIVLEALGEVLLMRLERGLQRQGAGLVRWRRLILAQEAAHHAFGRALVATLLADGCMNAQSVRDLALPYRRLAQRMIVAGSPALEQFGLTPEDIARDLDAHLGDAVTA